MIQTNNKTAVINIYEDAKFEQVNGMTVKITGTLNVYGVAADMTVMPSGADFKVFVDEAEQTTYVKDQTYTVKAFAPTPAPAPGGSTNPSDPEESTPTTPDTPAEGDFYLVGSINDANDLLYANGELIWFEGKRIDNPNTHGTGCTLSSAIASNLARGFPLAESVQRAKEYISGALAAMLDLGKGSGPVDHMYRR